MRMHRAGSGTVLGMALCVLAACGDTATVPTSPAPEVRASAIRDGLPLPELSPSVTGDDVQLTWTWSDDQDWAFVTFSITEEGVRQADGGKARPYAAGTLIEKTWTDYNVEAGDHVYCVEVMARSTHVPRLPSATYHSSACATVTVG